jgi:hypothetical protein
MALLSPNEFLPHSSWRVRRRLTAIHMSVLAKTGYAQQKCPFFGQELKVLYLGAKGSIPHYSGVIRGSFITKIHILVKI